MGIECRERLTDLQTDLLIACIDATLLTENLFYFRKFTGVLTN